ncbi:hypothetical protein ACFHW2_11530 [Actinomadura sp. LOL_016]|uniref:hypothetical protein n=1 Tax=unclassified Actinomadura TaxID=2626254 RepID=UPI003A810279
MAEQVPIPVRCAHRPTVRGLVVPWVTLNHPHAGHLLGQTRPDRVAACVRDRLCQTCGHTLGDRVVVICRPQDLADYSAEPGMHPECAAYSTRACPMLNGRMTHHRKRPVGLGAHVCGDPACTCRAWGDGPGKAERAGQPADEYVAVWLARKDYRPARGDDGEVRGVALRGVRFLRLRPVEAPHRRGPGGEMTQELQRARSMRDLLTAPLPGEIDHG